VRRAVWRRQLQPVCFVGLLQLPDLPVLLGIDNVQWPRNLRSRRNLCM